MSVKTSGEKFSWLVENRPFVHPASFSIRFFNYSNAPGTHLLDFYDSLHEACTKKTAPKQIARFKPRGHGKTESATVVFPTWALTGLDPSLSIAIISHKRGIANERAKKAVRYITEIAKARGIEILDKGATEIRLGPGMQNKEPSLCSMSVKSDWEGRHFDIIIWDDIATLKNQTTAERETILEQFRDRDNLLSPDPKIPGGGVTVVIGTRKHQNDIYGEEILKRNKHEWDGNVARHEGKPGWDVKVFRAIGDWSVVENKEYEAHGTDGETYDDLESLPDDVGLVNNGIVPTSDVKPLWADQKPPEQLVTEALTSYTPSWKRENQQDPEALKGEYWQFDWLRARNSLPKEWDKYRWYAGLDFAKTPDVQKAESQDTDYWALVVIAHDSNQELSYAVDMWRKRGLSQYETATEWVPINLKEYPVGELIVESNFKGKEIADTIEDQTDLRVKKSESEGDKDERLDAKVGNKVQQGKLRFVLPDEKYESWVQDEYLAFPNYHKIDRTDALEIALRGPEDEFRVVEDDELTNLTFE